MPEKQQEQRRKILFFLSGILIGLGILGCCLSAFYLWSSTFSGEAMPSSATATQQVPSGQPSPSPTLAPLPTPTPTLPPPVTPAPTVLPTSPPPSATPTPLPPTATPTAAATATPTVAYPPTPIPYTCPGIDDIVTRAGPVTPDDERLAVAGATVLCAIRDNRWDVVASYVHPDVGELLFSPDVYIGDPDLEFPADWVPGLPDDTTEYVWGTQPGSGMPIRMTFRDYVATYVYDADYWTQSQPGLDVRRGTSTVRDNHNEVYPGSRVVEFHIPPSTPGGLDWKSLRLVFLPLDGEWRLVAITRDAWAP